MTDQLSKALLEIIDKLDRRVFSSVDDLDAAIEQMRQLENQIAEMERAIVFESTKILNCKPPAIAETVIMMLAKDAKSCAANIGDMEEQFHIDAARYGVRRARRMYWAQTLRSIEPLAWQAVKRLGVAAAALAGAKKWLGL